MFKKSVISMSYKGIIENIFVDELELFKDNSNFIELVDKKSYKEYFNLLNLLDDNKEVLNIKLNLKSNNSISSYYINGINLKNKEIIILSENIIDDNKTIKDIMSINNIQTNQIRKIVKNQKQSSLENNQIKDFTDITKLNNDLINTKRKLSKTNIKLENLNIKFKSIIENIHEMIALVSLDGIIILSNNDFKRLTNNVDDFFDFIKNNNLNLFKKIEKAIKEFVKSDDLIVFEDVKLGLKSNIYYDIRIFPIFNENDEKLFYTFTLDDVTKRKKNLRKLKYLKKAFNQSKESIAITNIDGRIIFANKAFSNEYGYKNEKIINENINFFIKKAKKNEEKILKKDILYNKTKKGKKFPVEISKTEVYDNSRVVSYIYIIKNISERIEYEKKLIILATRDKMTEAYSREAGIEYLKNIINNKDKSNNISILFVDINGLKSVNDNYGHKDGDSLIIEVTESLKNSIRGNDIVTRLGGDEFLVVLSNSNKKNALKVKKRILNDISNKNKSNNYNFEISVSIGIANYLEKDFISIDQFINLADKRMYDEKNNYYNNKN